MPREADEEHGFVYLSDPFIRHLTGPQLKLTERRRLLAYNHMRMIGHAAMLYHTQFGTAPESLHELAESGCAPGVFGEGNFAGPSGGTYLLSADGSHGISSVYGHPLNLVPCCEVPIAKASSEEANEYKQFVSRYEQYWRTFFDPIAIQIQITPERYRFETIVLPLINNSIYTNLSSALGGAPEPLDELPVPEGNIFSLAVKLDKPALLKQFDGIKKEITSEIIGATGVSPQDVPKFLRFIWAGLGNQMAMHVYDTTPTFDFNLTGFLGQALGSFNSRSRSDDMLIISLLITSLNSPVYMSIPVKDTKIVDEFLDQVDKLVAIAARKPTRSGFFELDYDFYKMPLGDMNRMV